MTTADLLRERVVAAIGAHYELEAEIGRGGMAVVYRARDPRLNRPVAVKVLPPELAYDPAIRTRFTREAQTSAQLQHAHIVPIYDVGEREGIAYFVMALVGGGNLAAQLAREPRLPIGEVRRLLCEIADALAYAHLRGVVHRDIKPDNILLDAESGRAMVTDFGIARAMEAGTRLTVTGNAVGTPTYMSPEQAVGEREVDGRSDIYSLGVLAYQMVTGRVPFTGANSMALLMKHVTEPPRPIAELRPDAPRALREAIERALLKAPEDRWPTATAMREALLADDAAAPPWRADHRAPSRWPSPRPEGGRRDRQAPGAGPGAGRATSPRDVVPAAAGAPGAPAHPPEREPAREIVLVPEHLAPLTREQRADLRLWHGRVDLRDRIRAARGYAVLTVGAIIGGIAGFVAGVSEVPPFVVAPIVPIYMSRKLWLRAQSLREAGLRLRRVFLMPRSRWVIPAPAPAVARVERGGTRRLLAWRTAERRERSRERQLEKLAPREVLDGPHGGAIRRAVEDREAIEAILAGMSRADRALVPDVDATARDLVQRVASLARMVHGLDRSIDPRLTAELDARVAELEREGESPERERRRALLERQRGSLEELVRHRAALLRQLDSAGLALGGLRLDLIRLRSSGLQSALTDISSATREARALSREIGEVLKAVEEVRGI